VRTHYEGRKGLKDLGSGRPRYLKKLQLESTGNVIKTYDKTTGLDTVKGIARSPLRLQKIKNYIYTVEGSTPSKRKKGQC
jgi:hypothetical protein